MLYLVRISLYYIFFFFNDTATTEIYTLSLHDALPLSEERSLLVGRAEVDAGPDAGLGHLVDRKSTRLNSSHRTISYAVFCLKKKTILPIRYPFSLGDLYNICVVL